MNLWCIGDVHGSMEEYMAAISTIKAQEPEAKIIQLGDIIGGYKHPLPSVPFIRGNHDDPAICRQYPNYLGDFGVWEGIFFVSGAWSINEKDLTPMHNWWPDEQLNWQQSNECVRLFSEVKPKVVVSHDCPINVAYDFWKVTNRDNTKMLLQEMFDIHQPDLWVFGHHHKDMDRRTMGTRFVCVGCDIDRRGDSPRTTPHVFNAGVLQ
jgi:predicted phosphodiesterase